VGARFDIPTRFEPQVCDRSGNTEVLPRAAFFDHCRQFYIARTTIITGRHCTRRRERRTLPSVRTVRGNDEWNNHMSPPPRIHDLVSLASAQTPILTQSPLRWLPPLPSSRTLCHPSTIKTRASGSPLKRLETCETADRSPPVQIPSVCTISLTRPHIAPFPRPLTTFTRVSPLTARPRSFISDLFDITDRPGRRCQFSRLRRPCVNNISRKHRLTSL
jgi:hypothetical protein